MTTKRNRDVPTAHPHARLCRRRKGAKGDKRYAAACKRIVGKPHTATKNASMLPCRATSPTAGLRGLEHTKSQGGGHGEHTHKKHSAGVCRVPTNTRARTHVLFPTGPEEKRMLVSASSGR